MASIVVQLSNTTKERLRQRAVRRKRSLEAEVRAVLERAAQEVGPSDASERLPDWFIRMKRPGIELDAAIEENRRSTVTPGKPAPERHRGSPRSDE